MQLVAVGVEHDAQRHQRLRVRRRTPATPTPCRPPARRSAAAPGGAPARRAAGSRRSGRRGHGARRGAGRRRGRWDPGSGVVPVGPRSSLAEHDVAGLELRVERAAETGDQDRARRPRRRARRGRPGAGPSRSGGRPPRRRRRGQRAPRPTAARARSARSRRHRRSAARPWLSDRRHRLARGRPAAANRALHRRRPAGVGPGPGEHQAGDRRPRTGAQRARPRRGAERRRVLAGDEERSRPRASRAAGSSSASAGRKRARSSSPVMSSSASAADSETARYWPCSSPAPRVRSNTHCTGVRTPAANGSSSTRRS